MSANFITPSRGSPALARFASGVSKEAYFLEEDRPGADIDMSGTAHTRSGAHGSVPVSAGDSAGANEVG